jgi:hypothetical protein
MTPPVSQRKKQGHRERSRVRASSRRRAVSLGAAAFFKRDAKDEERPEPACGGRGAGTRVVWTGALPLSRVAPTLTPFLFCALGFRPRGIGRIRRRR